MGRLALAGLDPARTPLSVWWRAVWSLLVDWHLMLPEGGADAVRAMWVRLGGPGEMPDVPAAAAGAAGARRPAPAARPGVGPPTRPGDKREGRPSPEDIRAWALASAASGSNFIGSMPTGEAGSAERVGG